MIEWVDAWLAEHADEVRSRGVAVDVTHAPTDRPKRSVSVVLDAGDALAQLVVWDTGEGLVEFGDVVSGVRTPRHLAVPDAEFVTTVLRDLLTAVETERDQRKAFAAGCP